MNLFPVCVLGHRVRPACRTVSRSVIFRDEQSTPPSSSAFCSSMTPRKKEKCLAATYVDSISDLRAESGSAEVVEILERSWYVNDMDFLMAHRHGLL